MNPRSLMSSVDDAVRQTFLTKKAVSGAVVAAPPPIARYADEDITADADLLYASGHCFHVSRDMRRRLTEVGMNIEQIGVILEHLHPDSLEQLAKFVLLEMEKRDARD